MDLGHPLVYLLVLCLLFFFPLVLLLPAVLRFSVRVPLSLRYFLGGAVWLAAYLVARIRSVGNTEGWILFGMFLFSPLWFSIGARRSLREVGSHRAKLLRWVNVVGFGLSVGLIAWLLLNCAWWRLYFLLIPLTTAAVMVLAFSRVVLWQPPTKSRWAGFLPGYPAILLMPAVLVVWAVLCTDGQSGYESGAEWYGWGFPLPFYGVLGGPDGYYDGLRFRLTPYLVDLLLAVVVAWVLAMAADPLVPRLVRPRRWWREVRSMRFRWSRLLPGYPAALVVPAVLALWATFCMLIRHGSDGLYGWGFPLRFFGWFPDRIDYGFRIAPFQFDLVLALVTGYILAMTLDRLLFPAIRGARRKKLRKGEAG